MDALVCKEPGSLSLMRRPAPERQPGDVLVRPRRAGICGTDYHIFEGKHPFLQYPRVMGHELAVEVVQAPEDSDIEPGTIFAVNPYIACGRCVACRRGKPNCCVQVSVLGVHRDGGMAELLAMPVENLIPVPGLTLDQAAMVEFLAIGAHAVRRGGVGPDDRVLVVGAGPIGLGVALFARLSRSQVVIVDRDPQRVEIARRIVDASAFTVDELGSARSETISGEGFDVVFDATGSPVAMQEGFDHTTHGGRYVLVSVVKDSITFSDPDFHRKELSLLGSRNATAEDFARVVTAIGDGSAPVDLFITHRTTLADAVRDLPCWASEKDGLTKAIINLS